MFNTSNNSTPSDSIRKMNGVREVPTTSRSATETEAAFLNAPQEVRQLVYAQLSYEELAKARLVCRAVGREAWYALNKGFKDFNAQLERERHQLKRDLPRRESDRRKHRLFPYSEIIASMETRRDLLDMTYGKFMDKDVVCFIPGKVLDEGFRLLRYLRANKGNGIPMNYELLKDFRDLSSMAIDHFDEYIAPKMRKKTDAFYSSMMSGLKRSTLGILSFPTPKSGFLSSVPSTSRASAMLELKRPGTNYLQQRMSEQDAIIKKQNEKIEGLRTVTGLLLNAVEQLAQYVELNVPTEQIREVLAESATGTCAEEETGDGSKNDESTTDLSRKRRRQDEEECPVAVKKKQNI